MQEAVKLSDRSSLLKTKQRSNIRPINNTTHTELATCYLQRTRDLSRHVLLRLSSQLQTVLWTCTYTVSATLKKFPILELLLLASLTRDNSSGGRELLGAVFFDAWALRFWHADVQSFQGVQISQQKALVHRQLWHNRYCSTLHKLLAVPKRSSTLPSPLQLHPLASLPPKSSHLSV